MSDNKRLNSIFGGIAASVIVSFAGLVGGIVGGTGGPSLRDCGCLRREANRPAVFRTYESGRRDSIWIEDANSGKYVPLGIYLDRIKNKYDRDIEEARIKKTAGW